MKTKTDSVSFYNLFYLFICIVWIPIQRYYLHFDGAGRSIMLLSIIAIFLNASTFIKKKELFGSSAFICWTLLILFSMVNSYIKGFDHTDGALNFYRANFFDPFVFLVISIIEISKNKHRFLKVVLVAISIYLFIGVLNIGTNDDERQGAQALGNTFPITAAGAAFVISVLFTEKKMRPGLFIILITIISAIIVLSATRKAFGALVIVLVFAVLARMKKLNFRTLFVLLAFSVVLFLGMNYLMENSRMGERILSSSEIYNVELSGNRAINDFLMLLLGDRAEQYYLASIIWYNHPITGIGLCNYMDATSLELRLHTEYMVQLCENGIIGFALLMLFYYQLLKGLWKKHKEGYSTAMCLGGLLMVLFLNLSAWTYNLHIAMIIYALLITITNNKLLLYEKQ